MAIAAQAQDRVYIQIEAHPSLNEAEQAVRGYAARLQDVNGFALGGGWYAVALGPFDPDTAQARLRDYRRAGAVPSDSYVAVAEDYGQRFYPIGAEATQPAPQAPAVVATPEPDPQPVDETPAEARRSEALLTRDEKMDLQIALRWAGFYNSTIDAAFGAGTRNSMAAWQDANGYQTTGVLTTRQRAELIAQYNAVLEGMGMAQVRDDEAGISMQLPTGAVAFDHYEYPFAHYTGTGTVDGARVLLISQAGDQNTLFGLYDIMQTLEIVPLNGPRERRSGNFTLVGQNDRIVSHTEASLEGGEVKGFTLIWPAGDEERRTRILAAMQDSFARIPGAVLQPSDGRAEQDIDLLAGLEIRKPRLSRSGFYVNASGTVVTVAEAVQNCTRITLDEEFDATLVTLDEAAGIAVLRPDRALAPMSVAAFPEAQPRLQSEVAVSGYSFEGVLGAPTLTFGKLEDVKGLGGEPGLRRLALNHQPGDAGGPVLDAAGSVVGMLLPRTTGARQLPDAVSFATGSDSIRSVLQGAGLSAAATAGGAVLDPVDLTRIATGMTVLVSCWD